MADEPADYRQFAGRVVFPRSPADLGSRSLCPACQSPLTPGTICRACGLDLADPAIGELAALSMDAAAALERRIDLIGGIRYRTSLRLAEQARAAEARRMPARAPVMAAAAGSIPAPAATSSPAAAPPPAPAGPQRSSIQVILLVVGISLLSVAAIFFLVYAFITFGLLARSLIIGGITVAAVVAAILLRRRGLPATGEGIAAFAIVLVYLDAWAARANGLGGAGSADGAAYWGWTLVVSALGFGLWSRLSGIRTPNLVGFAAFAPGVGLIAAWAAGLFAPDDRPFAAFAAIALAGVVQRLAVRRRAIQRTGTALPERALSLTITSIALLAGVVTAFGVDPAADWGGGIALLVLGAIAAIDLVAIDLRPAVPPGRLDAVFGSIVAGIGSAAVAASGAAVAVRLGDDTFAVIAPALMAAIVAVVLDAAASRLRPGPGRRHAIVALFSAVAVTALTSFPPVGTLLAGVFTAIARGLGSAWTIAATGSLVPYSSAAGSAVIAVAAIIAAAAAVWTATGMIARRRTLLAWLVPAGALLAVPALQALWPILLAWIAIAAAALLVLLARPGRLPRAPMLSTVFAGTALAYAAGWAGLDTWAPVTVVVVALLLAVRPALRSAPAKAAVLGCAVAVIVIGVAAAARELAMPLHPGILQDGINATRAIGFAATVLLGLAALLRSKRLSALDRRTGFWITVPAIAVSTVWAQASLHSLGAGHPFGDGLDRGILLPEYGTSLIAGLVLIAALASWNLGRETAGFRAERLVAAAALGPAVLLLADSFVRLLPLGGLAVATAASAAALITAAGALTLAIARPGSFNRQATDIGAAVVGMPATAMALVGGGTAQDSAWLGLEFAAVTVLLMAVSADGLFASASRRRQLGWLALALGTAGLWWALASRQVDTLEPYVLPLAGVLLLLALIARRSGARAARPSRVAPWLALAGLLVAVVPLGVESASGPLLRPLVVGGASAALLLAGALAPHRRTIRPYRSAAVLAGAIGVVLVSAGRALAVLDGPGTPDARLDLWVGAAVAVLAVAGWGLAGDRGGPAVGRGRRAGGALVIAGMLELAALEVPALSRTGLGFGRALALVLILAALHVIARAFPRPPLGTRIGWISVGLAAVAGSAGLISGAFDRVEFATVPVALALLVSGALHLTTTPGARSWAWLAPGTAVLLVPSLLADAGDAPLWRLVGLGVVGIALLVASVLLRLQAPFLISVVVLLIHAVATFAPGIRAVYQAVEWWVWLAVGGVIIVAISIRFERSRRGVRRLISSIASLR